MLRPWRWLAVARAIGCAYLACGCAAAPGPSPGAAQTARSGDIDSRIARIAEIGRGETESKPQIGVERVMKELDEDWDAFDHAGAAGQAKIRAAIDDEIARGSPRNDFLLLDLGRFLVGSGGDENAKAAERALIAIDPDGRSLGRSWADYFRFTHAVARGRPQVRVVIDRGFLGKDRAVFLPGDRLPLAPHIVTTALYGVTGPDAEDHLTSLLARPETPHRDILEALVWLGTERSVDAVAAVLRTDGSKEVVVRAVTMLMKVGGPRGRDAVLAIDASRVAADARAYLDEIRSGVAALSGKQLAAEFAPFRGARHIEASELRARLDRMVANDGRDDDLNPTALLTSDLPTQELVARLAAVRSALLRTISDRTLEDVETTNALIDAVEWRGR